MFRIIKQHHRKAILTAPIIFLLIAGDKLPPQNGIFVKPSTYFPEVGATFFVDVAFRSNVLINATDGTLSLPPESVSVERVDLTRSQIDLWGSQPEFSTATGIVAWSGGIIKPELKDNEQNTHILRVFVRAKQAVPTKLLINDATLLKADGAGTNTIENVTSILIHPRPKGGAIPDIDGDKRISVKDVSMVILNISKKYDQKYDINGDKAINYKDVNMMLDYYEALKNKK